MKTMYLLIRKKLFYSLLHVIAFILYSALPVISNGQYNTRKTIGVTTNKNVELFGLMVQLDNGAGLEQNNDSTLIENKKIAWKDWYALTLINYERYKAFENDTVIKFYRRLAQKGISDDFIYGFLIQCNEIPTAAINATTDISIVMGFSKRGDSAEAFNTVKTFLHLFNAFNKKINFKGYLRDNRKNYATIISDIKKNLPSNLIPVMENFYQKQFSAYYLVPGLNVFPTTGFGKMNRSTNTIYNILGGLGLQSFKSTPPVLAFDHAGKLLALTVHEFGHSFVNPAIDKVPKDIIEKTEYLYTPVKNAMSGQGYISWNICLYEHFVRAGEVLIARQLGQFERAQELIEGNVKGSFWYLPQIIEQLEIYSKHHDLYKSYDDYIIQVIQNLKPVKNQ